MLSKNIEILKTDLKLYLKQQHDRFPPSPKKTNCYKKNQSRYVPNKSEHLSRNPKLVLEKSQT